MTNYLFTFWKYGMDGSDGASLGIFFVIIWSCGLYPLGLLITDIITLPITIPLTIITSIYSFYKKITKK